MQLRLRSDLVLLTVGIGVFAAVLAFFLVRAGTEGAPELNTGVIGGGTIEIGSAPPDFVLESVREPGALVRLSDHQGKVVVVNFYASWCGPCRQELPDFEQVSREFADEVVFIAVNVQESRDQATGILDETGVTFTAVLDADGAVANAYRVQGMPSTYLLDADGILRKFGPGAIDGETLRQELRAILADQEPH